MQVGFGYSRPKPRIYFGLRKYIWIIDDENENESGKNSKSNTKYFFCLGTQSSQFIQELNI